MKEITLIGAAEAAAKALVELAPLRGGVTRATTSPPIGNSFGPSTPGGSALTLWVDSSRSLYRACVIAADLVAEPTRPVPTSPVTCCHWAVAHAETFAAHPVVARDLAIVFDHISVVVGKYMDSLFGSERRLGDEPRQLAAVVCQRLARAGYTCSPTTLRQWVVRSTDTPAPITTVVVEGQARYLISEVIKYIQWRDRNKLQ